MFARCLLLCRLHGCIECTARLVRLAGLYQYSQLGNVFLQGNNFTGGTLPSSWGVNATSFLASTLNVLMLNNAQLQGSVPSSWTGLVSCCT
jgi:hypothetical protein